MTMVPKTSIVAVLGNPGSSTHAATVKSIQLAASTLGVRILAVEARTAEELERGFAMMTREHAGALIIAADAFLVDHWQQIAALAIRHRLPSIAQNVEYTRAGGMMSYGYDLLGGYRLAATYVDKILKGAKPADLPVQQPTQFELVINAKTARALGLAIPPALLAVADEVIE